VLEGLYEARSRRVQLLLPIGMFSIMNSHIPRIVRLGFKRKCSRIERPGQTETDVSAPVDGSIRPAAGGT